MTARTDRWRKMRRAAGTLLVLALVYEAVARSGYFPAVLLPTLPSIPQAMAWAALLAPVVWTAVSYTLLGIINPGLRGGVSWPWFVLSQLVYGVAVALVVTQATGLSPIARGLAGGLFGGVLMPLPALLWSLGTGRGVWYPLRNPATKPE